MSRFVAFLFAGALLFVGCADKKEDSPVLSKRYVHKYGYAMSQEEWESRNYPGQVVTNMRDGVTITTTYEHGILHGSTTYTYPHSQTIKTYLLYTNGNLVSRVDYDVHGMPAREEVYISPSRYKATVWYENGSPLSIEEWGGPEIVEGQYFTVSNDIEASVTRGSGVRVGRSPQGLLLFRDEIDRGYVVKKTLYYPSAIPQCVAYYHLDKLDGQRTTFNEEGEPQSVEEWKEGQLHGMVVYFHNGVKVSEVSFLHGKKNGTERHLVDGEHVSQEIAWENDRRHGPSTFFNEGGAKTDWYYDGRLVSQRYFDEQTRLDEMISGISDDVKIQSGPL